MKYDDLGPKLLVEHRGDVRIVTMNAPDRLNCFDDDLHDAMTLVWDRLADDDDAAAVVLTGAGRAFSAGGDFDNFVNHINDRDARRRAIRHAERLARRLIECELPIVAAVNGPAIGLGASIAVMCDIVVMADNAFMSDPHVNNGLVAGDGGPVTWPHHMSLLHAKEHILLGDRLDASRCERLGLANRVVSPDDLMPTALDYADRLAAQPRQALRDTKRALNVHLRNSADLMLSFALAAETYSFTEPDVQVAVERFRNKEQQKSSGGNHA